MGSPVGKPRTVQGCVTPPTVQQQSKRPDERDQANDPVNKKTPESPEAYDLWTTRPPVGLVQRQRHGQIRAPRVAVFPVRVLRRGDGARLRSTRSRQPANHGHVHRFFVGGAADGGDVVETKVTQAPLAGHGTAPDLREMRLDESPTDLRNGGCSPLPAGRSGSVGNPVAPPPILGEAR